MYIYNDIERDSKGKRTKCVLFVDNVYHYNGWTITRKPIDAVTTMYLCVNVELKSSFETSDWSKVKSNINFFTKQLKLF